MSLTCPWVWVLRALVNRSSYFGPDRISRACSGAGAAGSSFTGCCASASVRTTGSDVGAVAPACAGGGWPGAGAAAASIGALGSDPVAAAGVSAGATAVTGEPAGGARTAARRGGVASGGAGGAVASSGRGCALLALEVGRDLAHASTNARRRHRLGEELPEHLERCLALERPAPRQEFVEDDTDGVQVAACIERIGVPLLRAHVAGGAADDPGLRQRRRAIVGLLDLRDPEVEHLHEIPLVPARPNHHVGRLEIPVQDAVLVGLGEGAQDLRADADHTVLRDRELLDDHAAEVLAVNVLHRHEERSVRQRAEVGHLDDVRVSEAGGGARLALEPLDEQWIGGERPLQDLERHGCVESDVPGQVHVSHAAAADPLVDVVGLLECRADERVLRGGGLRGDRCSAREAERGLRRQLHPAARARLHVAASIAASAHRLGSQAP